MAVQRSQAPPTLGTATASPQPTTVAGSSGIRIAPHATLAHSIAILRSTHRRSSLLAFLFEWARPS